MNSDFEPIYTVNNLFNDFIMLQYFFLREIYVFIRLSRILYHLQVTAVRLSSPSGASIIKQYTKSTCRTGSTVGTCGRFSLGIQTKQEPDDSINCL